MHTRTHPSAHKQSNTPANTQTHTSKQALDNGRTYCCRLLTTCVRVSNPSEQQPREINATRRGAKVRGVQVRPVPEDAAACLTVRVLSNVNGVLRLIAPSDFFLAGTPFPLGFLKTRAFRGTPFRQPPSTARLTQARSAPAQPYDRSITVRSVMSPPA